MLPNSHFLFGRRNTHTHAHTYTISSLEGKMSITEFVTLKLTQSPPHTFDSPTLLPLFTRLAQLQGAYSSHPLLYFQNVTPSSVSTSTSTSSHTTQSSDSPPSSPPSSTAGEEEDGKGDTIYLISGWESVEKHEEWMASSENQSFLKELAAYVAISSLIHVDMDFSGLQEKIGNVCGIEVEVRELAAFNRARACQSSAGNAPEDLIAIWRGCGEDVEGKSGEKRFGFRAYDEDGWKLVLRGSSEGGRRREGVELAVRMPVELDV